MGKELEGVVDALTVGCRDVKRMAAVVLQRGTDVPTVDAMAAVGGALLWGVVGEDATTRRSEWCGVEVEGAVQLQPSGQMRIDVGLAKKVEGEYSLGDKAAPQMEGESRVKAGETGDEVTLESVDGFFGRVGAMVVGGGELELDVGLAEETFERRGSLVVALLEHRFVSTGNKVVVQLFVGSD